MYIRTLRSAAVVGILSAIAAPVTVFADGAYHATTSELGATYHPDHASKATRAQVAADLDQAKRHPAWNTAMSRGAPWPAAKSAEPKTRAQVNAELERAMKHPAWSSVSRGAPWPPVMADAK